MQKTKQELLRPQDIAKELGCCVAKVLRLVRGGDLDAISTNPQGNRQRIHFRITRESYERFLRLNLTSPHHDSEDVVAARK